MQFDLNPSLPGKLPLDLSFRISTTFVLVGFGAQKGYKAGI